jgi:mono/diheme cytochrome c family protein
LALLAIAWIIPALRARADDPTDVEFFEKEVRPIFATRCQGCHGPEKHKGDLRLDSRASILKGGRTGPAVVPGKPEESLLVDAINYGDLFQMPPKSKLAGREIQALTQWVAQGAPWPREDHSAASSSKAKTTFDLKARAKHWSFQPIRRPEPPSVKDSAWPRTPVDRFLLAKLEAQGLAPAPDADRRTLLRRVTYDLIGLPPTPAEIAAFLADPVPDAYEKVVDRLLASPHYGERWGRHWLDLVRFAETSGHEFDYDIPNAWRYRDYVIRALNDDLPYDRFVVEHVAGDLLSNPRRHPTEGWNESIAATGFYFLGEGTHSPVDVRDDAMLRLDNQVDVLAKAFLGLTVACARCHDHKFDAISTKDYYALAGFLRSSRHQQAFLDAPERIAGKVGLLRTFRDELQRGIPDRVTARDPVEPPKASSGEPPCSVEVFEDFGGARFDGWSVTGDAFGGGPIEPGEWTPRPDGQAGLIRLPHGVAHSAADSPRLQGVLRSKTFTISKKFIHVLASGQGGRINVVIDGYEKIRDPIYGGLTRVVNRPRAWAWETQDVGMWLGHTAYLELADGAVLDYNGPQTKVDSGEGFLAVDEIRFSDGPPPADCRAVERLHWLNQVAKAPPLSVEDISRDLVGAGLFLDTLAQFRETEAQIPPPTLAPAVADGTGEDLRIHLRGSYKTLGDVAPRRFLEAIVGPSPIASPEAGSGRLALARALVDPSNPFLPRVLVNRLWKHHFGRGIVPTCDDFGAMGQPPSHPDLLDDLASRFLDSGWSLKAVHRLIVLSHAYRMSSRPDDAEAEHLDPTNVLLHRMNVRRLEAEAIRDAILAVSGRLDSAFYGPSVPPPLTPFMEGRGRPLRSGPLDGAGRRSLYLNVRRNFLTPMLLAFDYPVPFSTMGRRNVSNVPAQALTMMNDPFIIEQARIWADRARAGRSPEQAVAQLYERAFGRAPTERETAEALKFVAQQAQSYGEPDPAKAWGDLGHVLLNVKEFVFVN